MDANILLCAAGIWFFTMKLMQWLKLNKPWPSTQHWNWNAIRVFHSVTLVFLLAEITSAVCVLLIGERRHAEAQMQLLNGSLEYNDAIESLRLSFVFGLPINFLLNGDLSSYLTNQFQALFEPANRGKLVGLVVATLFGAYQAYGAFKGTMYLTVYLVEWCMEPLKRIMLNHAWHSLHHYRQLWDGLVQHIIRISFGGDIGGDIGAGQAPDC